MHALSYYRRRSGVLNAETAEARDQKRYREEKILEKTTSRQPLVPYYRRRRGVLNAEAAEARNKKPGGENIMEDTLNANL
jgi:hypothetical protein